MSAQEHGTFVPPQGDGQTVPRELLDETMLLVLAGLFVIAVVLIPGWSRREILCATALLLVLPVVVWALRYRSYRAAAWLLVVGCVAIDLLVASGDLAFALFLMALPAGFATLFISAGAGLLTGVLCTLLLLLAPPALAPADAPFRIAVLMELWGTVGLIALATRPLFRAFEWAWSSYEHSRQLLEQARDQRVQLKQTLADLARANEQLTRLNHLAHDLRQAADDARRAKEQFVANVSHELRTPLNMIVGFGEMIVRSPETYGKVPRALLADLAIILRNSQHLSSLIDDVLDLSQIEAGRMALTKERAALAVIIEGAAEAVRPLFASKGLYLHVDAPPDLIVCGDRTRLREVVLNLLSNAGRFTDQGGVHIRAWRDRDDAVVSVADTGPGISPESIQRVFQPFEQLGGSIHSRYGGTGLGLSISRTFVELHGGKMWLESTPGAGATFFFRIPIDPPVPQEGAPARWLSDEWEYRQRTYRPVLPPVAVRPRFMIVEKREALGRLAARYLGDVETVQVTTLEEARAEAARVPAQALLVNDAEVGRGLQEVSRSGALPAGIPVIVCSLPGANDAAGSLGVSDYLVKPVSIEQLHGALERLQLQGRTVLIVDDEPEALQLFERMLSTQGRRYRMLQAENGEQAMEALRDYRPDVVLLDLAMPQMDGFQFLAELNRDPALRETPVIVISARDPGGQPLVSSAVAATREGGLSASELLACIEALSGILGPSGRMRASRGRTSGPPHES